MWPTIELLLCCLSPKKYCAEPLRLVSPESSVTTWIIQHWWEDINGGLKKNVLDVAAQAITMSQEEKIKNKPGRVDNAYNPGTQENEEAWLTQFWG